MRALRWAILVLCCSYAGFDATPARAQGVCHELWVARNTIFKAYGYCFKTARAIRYFGNAGCQYDDERDLPMSRADRARVNQIVREERRLGCR
jgi:hypothetical protein